MLHCKWSSCRPRMICGKSNNWFLRLSVFCFISESKPRFLQATWFQHIPTPAKLEFMAWRSVHRSTFLGKHCDSGRCLMMSLNNSQQLASGTGSAACSCASVELQYLSPCFIFHQHGFLMIFGHQNCALVGLVCRISSIVHVVLFTVQGVATNSRHIQTPILWPPSSCQPMQFLRVCHPPESLGGQYAH